MAVKYDLRTLLFCEALLILSLAYRVIVSITFRYHGFFSSSPTCWFSIVHWVWIYACIAMIASNTMISLLKLGFLNQIILATIIK
jgi:hypothetical protein